MPKFSRFGDLTEKELNRDLHVHTIQTDGHDTIPALITEAGRRGLLEIAFTEHVRKNSLWYADFAREVRRQAREAPLSVYVGLEAKAMDTEGTLDASDEMLQECDLVLGSVHRFPDGKGGVISAGSLPFEEAARIEFALSMGLLKFAPIHVLAHPGGMCQRSFGSFPEALFRTLIDESFERRIAIEINSSYLVDFRGFIRLCRELNPYVSVGSDVHQLSDLGNCRDRLQELAIV